jgi:CRP-like cAMP-binding protein
MSSANFMKVMSTTPPIATKLVELLVTKIRRLSERVFEVSALSVRERVRRELIRLAADGTRLGQGIVIRPAPTHYEIAARIGSHREAVTREFNRLEENRIVEIRRRQIRIVNLELLKEDEFA